VVKSPQQKENRMAKSNRRKQIVMSQKARRKLTAKYLAGGGKSKYARKHAYLNKAGLWGFEVPTPKPWQGKTAIR